jgi:hypothetical protein
MKAKALILAFLLATALGSCQHRDINEIETTALVLPEGYRGPILVFYEQAFEKGQVDFREGKHYIYVPPDGVVFTKYKMGKGKIKYYNERLEETHYNDGTFNRAKLDDNRYYHYSGSSYRGFEWESGKVVWCSIFEAGWGRDLKAEGAYVGNGEMVEIYEKTLAQFRD